MWIAVAAVVSLLMVTGWLVVTGHHSSRISRIVKQPVWKRMPTVATRRRLRPPPVTQPEEKQDDRRVGR
jgi:hypothetical protein